MRYSFLKIYRLDEPALYRQSIYRDALPCRSARSTDSPLLFISFVENAFKHGVSYRNESFIRVLVQLEEDNRLSFRCTNSNNGSADEQHHGIGLENVRKRLRLLFGNDYTLSITNEEQIFDVLLIIPLL